MEAGPAFGSMFLMMALAMQGANDMLDYVQPQTYWKDQGVEMTVAGMSVEAGGGTVAGDAAALVKQLGDADFKVRDEAQRKIAAMGEAARAEMEKAAKSDDPEVATRAQALLQALKGRAQDRPIRQLMAIKALGELKDKQALPVLQPLLQSKEPFVADYAAESIAAIEGKPYRRPQATDKELASDLALLPGNCAFVGQMRFPGGGKPDFAKAFESIPAEMLGGVNKDDLIRQASQMVMQAAGFVGNIRAQALTVGVADDVGDQTGFVVLVGRGKYQPETARKPIMEEMRDRPVQRVDKIEVLSPDREVAMILPSDDRFVMIAGPGRDVVLPYEPVAKAILGQGGKGIEANEEMAKLIASIDRTKPVWAVARITPAYRELPFLVPFDTMTLEGEEKDGNLRLRLVAKGKDAEAIGLAVEQFEQMRQEVLREVMREAQQMPPLKPIADLFESVKVDNAGQTVTVTGELKGGGGAFMAIPLMFFGMSTTHAQPAPAMMVE
jgi:hypothetical protein